MEETMEDKIRLGISSCLLGEKVRYDGGHKLDHYLKDTLGQFVEWTPVCPEVECGLTVPREAMHLAGTTETPRLVTRKTGTDYTGLMQQWAEGRIEELEKEDLCGFIFKSRSPSSGMRGVKVYNPSGIPSTSGVGIFARAYMEHFPLMPVEDDGRLNDPYLRENFIERIFVFKRWKGLVRKGGRIRDLVDFHSDHKLLILSHSPRHYSALGRLVANAKDYQMESLQSDYLKILMEGLKLLATVKKNTNVLHHMMGYFKKQLQHDEKKEMIEVIEEYHRGLVPLVVPIVLVRHYARKYDEPYLKRQYYLNPHPVELMLRNHV
jgi:uncharacterized protein YbgA (DUF1722 family)/uncharacterized protein YbbK (DUF523 family)